MPEIGITVSDRVARPDVRDVWAVCGNSDYTITWTLDAEWSAAHIRTAVFVWRDRYTNHSVPVIFEGTSCPMPAIPDALVCAVGLWASVGEGEDHILRTTSPAMITMRRSSTADTDRPIITQDVYDELLAAVNAALDAPVQAAAEQAAIAAGHADDAANSASAAAGSATAAAESAASASASKTAAAGSASAAHEDSAAAIAAKNAAETAQGIAEEARDTAVSAKNAAETAQRKAETAQGKAETAKTAAEAAAQSATGSASSASASATAAGSSATSAAGSASSAHTDAAAALEAKNTAVSAKDTAVASKIAAEAAQGAAENAATNASGSATAAANSATAAAASAAAAAEVEAQAEEVAESIPEDYSELSDDVADLKNAIHTSNTFTGWEKGAYRPDDGTYYANESYIRCPENYISLAYGTTEITADTGYNFMVWAWDLSGTYIGSYHDGGTFTPTAGAASVTSFDCGEFPNYKFRVAVARDPASTSITPDEGIHLKCVDPTDKSLSIEGKAADAKATGELKNLFANAYPIETVSGDVVTFETLNGGIDLDALNVNIHAVQSGSGDPSPENIRPITGFDKCRFIACGKNLFNKADYTTAGWTKVEDADYQDHYAGNKNSFYYMRGRPDGSGADPNALGLLPIRKALGRVSFSFHKHNSSNERVYYHYTDAVDWENHSSNISSAGDKSYVSKPNRVCNGVSLYTTQGSSATGSLSQLQVEIGTVKTAYEPFKGTSSSVDFGEAGTVYGGHLDVLDGVLTVTHGEIASYAGETLPGKWISSMDVYAEGATPTTGAQVVYELETPVEYQVTPVSVVTQSGINTVFADTGDVEVSYRADFGTLEDDIGARTAKTAVSAVETYAQATRAYAVGELLTLGDSLYVVTQPISVDGAIVIGANVRKTTISDIIAPRSYTSGIADYYIDEMTDTVAKARNEMTEPSLVLLWTTDNHRWSGNAGGVQNFSNMIENMKAFAAQVPTDAVVCSGDLTDGDKNTDTTLARAYDCMAEFRSIGVPYIWAQGNHDTNYLGGTGQPYLFDLAKCFKAYFTDVRPGGVNLAENGTDYYIDYDRLNTRVVVLNANNTTQNIEYALGTTTAAWLSSDALDTDKNVILVSHQSPYKFQVIGQQGTTRADAVVAAVNDFISGGGNVVMISGHSHLDAAFVDPWVSVTEGCQRFRPNFPEDDTEQSYGMEDYIDVVRVAGRQQYTATEDLWSVCVYKPMSNEFSVIRFGAGKDRYFHVTPIAPATLTAKLTGEITWSSSDEAVATVADGVVTGVAAGRCAVLAKDETGNYECWVVVVE